MRTFSGGGGAAASVANAAAFSRATLRHIVEVDKLQQVAILDAILHPNILMLMVEVFAPLGEAHRRETLLIE